MGKATLTTDSPAMRDYVNDGTTGVFVPRGEPVILAHCISDLLGDSARREALGKAAAAKVRESFALANLWHSVSILLHGVCDRKGID
jgi:glycosyltransferase involved in cell wall biosynthesis